MLACGVILRWHADHTNPPKRKRFACICPVRGWFLMFNTRDIWQPSLLLPATSAGGGLDHDSHLELRAVFLRPPDDVGRLVAASQAEIIGRLDRWALRQVLAAVEQAETLTQLEADIMAEAIGIALALG